MDLLKCFGSLLKKDSQNLPTTGSRKISDLVDEDVYIEGEEQQEREYPEPEKIHINSASIKPRQLWNNSEIVKEELPENDFIEESLAVETIKDKEAMTERMIIEKIALEIFLNSELLNKLGTNIADCLLNKFSHFEIPDIEDKYKVRTSKFLERFDALLQNEFDEFSRTN